jgi:hypothetical protein
MHSYPSSYPLFFIANNLTYSHTAFLRIYIIGAVRIEKYMVEPEPISRKCKILKNLEAISDSK